LLLLFVVNLLTILLRRAGVKATLYHPGTMAPSKDFDNMLSRLEGISFSNRTVPYSTASIQSSNEEKKRQMNKGASSGRQCGKNTPWSIQ
jgi:hypothetical protein